jgi:hypothetical protein
LAARILSDRDRPLSGSLRSKLGTPRGSDARVDLAIVAYPNSIDSERALSADPPLADVGAHALRIALVRRAVPAASARVPDDRLALP